MNCSDICERSQDRLFAPLTLASSNATCQYCQWFRNVDGQQLWKAVFASARKPMKCHKTKAVLVVSFSVGESEILMTELSQAGGVPILSNTSKFRSGFSKLEIAEGPVPMNSIPFACPLQSA